MQRNAGIGYLLPNPSLFLRLARFYRQCRIIRMRFSVARESRSNWSPMYTAFCHHDVPYLARVTRLAALSNLRMHHPSRAAVRSVYVPSLLKGVTSAEWKPPTYDDMR